MTLKEFLLTVKMGYNNIVITESDDESFGTNNISNGRYLCVDSNVWFAETGEDILKYCPQMPKDWLDRRVTEINAITDCTIVLSLCCIHLIVQLFPSRMETPFGRLQPHSKTLSDYAQDHVRPSGLQTALRYSLWHR